MNQTCFISFAPVLKYYVNSYAHKHELYKGFGNFTDNHFWLWQAVVQVKHIILHNIYIKTVTGDWQYRGTYSMS